MAKVRRIKLGSQGLEVSSLELGCMSLTDCAYGPAKPEEDMIKLINHAVNSGITHLDTSDYYGSHANEILISKALKGLERGSVQLATKFGIKSLVGKCDIRGDPQWENSRNWWWRVKSNIGLSEASSSTIRRAQAIHPISALQLEWSLWTRVHEEDVIPTCRELGIGIVPYGPLESGFFASGPKLLDGLPDSDFRQSYPRLQGENLEHNKILFERIHEIALKKGCTPSQLALAWVLHQGDDLSPIPGTSKIENFNQNIGALSVKLSPEDMAELEFIASADAFKGSRLPPLILALSSVETPPLSSWK